MKLFPVPVPMRKVFLFTTLYLVLATFFVLQTHNWEFLFYIGVVAIIGIVILFIYEHVPLSNGLVWFLSVWGLLHMIGGIAPIPEGWPYAGTKAVFYSMWLIPDLLKYDQLVHAYGFGMATWVCWQTLKTVLVDVQPRFSVLVLCVLAGMGLGALNEVVEFVATLIIPNTNVGGYVNTGWDLVSNMVGCITAAMIIWGIPPRQKKVS